MTPFTDKQTERVTQVGEIGLIQQISHWLESVSPPAPYGMGDDCAVIESLAAERQIITVDTVTFAQHFDASIAPEHVGSKLIKRNLSDIAAMGGTPKHAVLALICGADLAMPWLERFFKGVRASCINYDIQLVGGDISRISDGNFSAVLTLTGIVETPKLRSGATIGDHIYVTGSLGGSILAKHYRFEPRLAEGQWLAQNSKCTALMDLTDGLSKDLKSLLPANAHAALELDHIPIANDARSLAKISGRSAHEHAFIDGEDYELLFTLDAAVDCTLFESKWQAHFQATPLSHIGNIRDDASNGHLINARTNTALPWTRGFEHLKTE